MKFCSACGEKVVYRVPEGDNRERAVCEGCARIHYENPRIIAGCLPIWKDSVLLCRRAIEPQHGLWTVPAGFMEKGESLEEGALRETYEEAFAKVKLGPLFVVYSVLHISQVQMFFLADLKSATDFKPGIETLETKLFKLDEIPWDEIAFSAVTYVLRRYVEQGREGVGKIHMATFDKARDGY
ncbi:MAG: NUDIX hydrolase [Deltaproteobacteria bacterium]|nr:NUDIX hydrolase [Deltaproteobacteria bacterium]MBT6433320.1 NUDIX hydrolase [Deltaproteobacteria bacterium]